MTSRDSWWRRDRGATYAKGRAGTRATRESGGSTRAGVVEYTRVPRTREYRRKECAREIDQTPLAKSDSSRASEMTALQRRATKVRSPARYLRGTAAIKANATTSREPNERAREREEATSQQQQQKQQQRRRKRNDTHRHVRSPSSARFALSNGARNGFFGLFCCSIDFLVSFVRCCCCSRGRGERDRYARVDTPRPLLFGLAPL